MACDPPTQELAFLRETSTSAWHFGASPLGLREGQRLHFLSVAPAPCSLGLLMFLSGLPLTLGHPSPPSALLPCLSWED